MKNQNQIVNPFRYPFVRYALILMSLLVNLFISFSVLAEPPATIPSCEGIKLAYNVLGTQCVNTYAKVNHMPTNAKDRLSTYIARRTVLQIFRKALLCNGMYGAQTATQDAFKAGEKGHLTALAALHASMENDPNRPNLFTATDLNLVTITKLQCK